MKTCQLLQILNWHGGNYVTILASRNQIASNIVNHYLKIPDYQGLSTEHGSRVSQFVKIV